MTDFIGKSLGRYHVLEALGQGGMASVYKAYDTSLERNVAIKIIRPDVEESNPSEFLKRFQREARALAQLDHPYILKVLDYGEQEGLPYLVMPFVPGGTLKQKMGTAMPCQQAAALLAPIARALEYAHGQNIIHRDVKPANILISQSGAPLLSDFGIAKIISGGGATQLTATGVGIGTPDYMAPEQWMGVSDPGTDIYSLGVVFFEMVTGHRPYTADTPAAVMLKHLRDPLPRPTSFVPGLPEAVEQVLFKALDKEPKNRYQSMSAFAAALEKLARGEQPEVTLKTRLDAEATVLNPLSGMEGTRQAAAATASSAPKKKFETWQVVLLGLAGLAVIALVCVLTGGALFVSRTLLGGSPGTPPPVTIPAQADGLSGSPTSTPHGKATNLPELTETSTPSKPLESIEGLPADIPILQNNNGDLITSISQGMHMYTFSSNLAATEVGDFYTSGMERNGWKLVNEVTQNNSKIWYYTKNDNNLVMISVTETIKKSMVSIMIPPTPTSSSAEIYTCSDLSLVKLHIGSTGTLSYSGKPILAEPAQPGDSNYKEIRLLRVKERFAVIDGPKCYNDKTWWKIKTESSDTGWIQENYLR